MGNRGRPRYGHHRAAPVTGAAGSGTGGAPGSGTGDGAYGGPPGGGSTRIERRKLARKVKRKRRRSLAREVPLLVMVALLIALVLKTFLLQAFVIPSGSMEQTIKIGDRVLVDKLTPWFGAEPHRGDVVVFKDPGGWLPPEEQKKPDPVVIKQVKQFFTYIGLLPSADEQDLIKRVIGVGGDTVKCCDADGRITVNGVPLSEPYLYAGNPPSMMKFTVHVPQGRLWVMGDHRSDSADSRYHTDKPGGGTIPLNLVVGRAFVIAWPFGHWERLKEPGTFASVPDAQVAATAATAGTARVAQANNGQGTSQTPTPAELPLVMGVAGLRRKRGRRRTGVRSGCGGPGGRRTVWIRRARKRGCHGAVCRQVGGRWPSPRARGQYGVRRRAVPGRRVVPRQPRRCGSGSRPGSGGPRGAGGRHGPAGPRGGRSR
ncbi:signal peptidase I [Streptomyces sp. NPDC093221]|uniref:signal peptidase I n=1 Tax=Streptomyces sp. NPDC093221 TaxID=3366032 RepID=UPI0038270F15